MYTLLDGTVNAGALLLLLSLASTLVIGRFFCGWGCHIVAVQDFCGWIMKRMGIHPRPFRSRIMVWAPVILAVYMFAWPTLKREVLHPIVGEPAWTTLAPYLGEVGQRPELKAAFIKRDFWETFAPWYVAIPFVGVCGFAAVYFLGSKGFCTYGCPYGGIFGPVDRLAPGRIRVTDACEHCGHCTAVCTSNVRVHEEVRDFGMVVDPGCMKCMDCVSVCPNDALYFGFGAPPALSKSRSPSIAPRFKSRVFDLSWKEELGYGLVFLVLVFGFRGLLGLVPLLMAMALAPIGAFLLWKLIAMTRTPSVRVHSFQLKLKGSVRPAGFAFIGFTGLWLAAGLWGAAVNGSTWLGTMLDARIATPFDEVLTPNFAASDHDKALARAALPWLIRAGHIQQGGWGWDRSVDRSLRLARLHAILGDRAAGEADLRLCLSDTLRAGNSLPPVLENDLIRFVRLRSTSEQLAKELSDLLTLHPKLATTRLILAQHAIQQQRITDGIALIQEALTIRPDDDINRAFPLELLRQAERLDVYLEVARAGVSQSPRNAILRLAYGIALVATGETNRGLEELKVAADLDPTRPEAPSQIADILSREGRDFEATQWRERANRAANGLNQPPP